jgi:hypothetical protein
MDRARICDTALRWSDSGCCQDRRRRSGLTRQESGRFRACLAPDLSSGLPAPGCTLIGKNRNLNDK